MLAWLADERGIESHIPVFDKTARTDGSFAREYFAYDHEGDIYVCLAGKTLTCSGTLVNEARHCSTAPANRTERMQAEAKLLSEGTRAKCASVDQ